MTAPRARRAAPQGPATAGSVTWSSISRGPCPFHPVKTITWFSDRSGIASTGVSQAASAPRAASASARADDQGPVPDREGDDGVDHAAIVVQRPSRHQAIPSMLAPQTEESPLRKLRQILLRDHASSAPSHPSQHRKTTLPFATARAGVPIDPSGLPGHRAQLLPLGDRSILCGQTGKRVGELSRRPGPSRCWRTAGMVFAPARAEISGGQARVQSRFGVEQKGPGNRDFLAGFQPAHHRVEVAATRPEHHLDAVKHPGHALDEDHFLATPVDHRRSRHGQNLPRGSKRDNPRLELHPAAGAAFFTGVIGSDCRMHRTPEPNALVLEKRRVATSAFLSIGQLPGRERNRLGMVRADVHPARLRRFQRRRIVRHRAERLHQQTGALNRATTGIPARRSPSEALIAIVGAQMLPSAGRLSRSRCAPARRAARDPAESGSSSRTSCPAAIQGAWLTGDLDDHDRLPRDRSSPAPPHSYSLSSARNDAGTVWMPAS